MSLEGRTIVLGISGGIAAYKTVDLVSQLKKQGADVHVIATETAMRFVSPLSLQVMSGNKIHTARDWKENESPTIEHIELADKADMILIAPATANTLAKLVTGISDEILFDTVLATKAPIVVAPAMNTNMWEHATTKRNMQVLRESLNYHFVEPEFGDLACGHVGEGRLADAEKIIAKLTEVAAKIKKPPSQPEKGLAPTKQESPVRQVLQQAKPQPVKTINPKSTPIKNLTGRSVIITVGATREKIDPVRFITNKSSGKMGFALAEEAANQGMKVHVISTIDNDEEWTKSVEFTKVETHDEMYKTIFNNFVKTDPYSNPADSLIMVAAVADYKPLNMSENKIKKVSDDSPNGGEENKSTLNTIVDMINHANDRSGNLVIELEKTTDILQELSKVKQEHQILVGFSVETEKPVDRAKEKVKRKNLDFIVANTTDAFGADEAEVSIIGSAKRSGQMPMITSMPKESKQKIAHKVLEYLGLCLAAEPAKV